MTAPLNPQKTRSARAATSTYVVFAVLTGFPFVLFALIILRHGFQAADRTIAGVSLICLAAMAFAFFWISKFRIDIDDHAITYTRLFGGTVELPFCQIRRAALQVIRSGHKKAVQFLIERESGEDVLVNIKVFSLDTVAELFAAIEERAVAIEIPDDRYAAWIYQKAKARRPVRAPSLPPPAAPPETCEERRRTSGATSLPEHRSSKVEHCPTVPKSQLEAETQLRIHVSQDFDKNARKVFHFRPRGVKNRGGWNTSQ